jgi:hypothetical protein
MSGLPPGADIARLLKSAKLGNLTLLVAYKKKPPEAASQLNLMPVDQASMLASISDDNLTHSDRRLNDVEVLSELHSDLLNA